MAQAVIFSQQGVTGTVDSGAKNIPGAVTWLAATIALSAPVSPVNVFDIVTTIYKRAKPSDAWQVAHVNTIQRTLSSASDAITESAYVRLEDIGGWQLRCTVSCGQSSLDVNVVATWQ